MSIDYRRLGLDGFKDDSVAFATCYSIAPNHLPAKELLFTDYSEKVKILGITFEPDQLFYGKDLEQRMGSIPDNTDLVGFVPIASIVKKQMLEGLYDGASVLIYLTNPRDGSWTIAMSGTLSDISLFPPIGMTASIRGLQQALNAYVGRTFEPTCDACFGDKRCGVELSDHTDNVTIVSISDPLQQFRITINFHAGPIQGGTIVLGSTYAAGIYGDISREIKLHSNGYLTLALPLPSAVSVGLACKVIAGCDKTFDTCRYVFRNQARFRGFPYFPGQGRQPAT